MAIFPDICVMFKFWHAVPYFKPEGATFSAILEILNVFTPRALPAGPLWLKFSHALISTKLSYLWTDTSYRVENMDIKNQKPSCCEPGEIKTVSEKPLELFPIDSTDESACCGVTPGPRSSNLERPGYQILHFVEDMVDTLAGPVPSVKTMMEKQDISGNIKVRLGGQRENYSIAPGLYCVGVPDQDAPVLVTANYKLSFDALRKELSSFNAWILVLDTRGINVWCSAGKGTFSADEIVFQIKRTGLDKVVRHKKLVLPQLSAPGVTAGQVRKESGFSVIWGPVRAEDIKKFMLAGMKAEKSMREVTFTIMERLILVPVELAGALKPALLTLFGVFLLSGIDASIFSFNSAWQRGMVAATVLLAGIFAGAVAVPVFLPWIPVKAFYLKGAITGAAFSGIIVILNQMGIAEGIALVLFGAMISSFLAMNFTGSTPFTSPSGVEKEMRRAIPLQILITLVAAVVWTGYSIAV